MTVWPFVITLHRIWYYHTHTKKTNEKILLLYSVTYPAINSDSASVRSKGHLDVSSKKKIYSTSVSGKKKKKKKHRNPMNHAQDKS